MAQTTFKYSITIEGNDIDAKNAKSLKVGDSLSLERVYDEVGTYEIVVFTPQNQPLDMLGYKESVGIAPFIDDQTLKIISATVENVKIVEGKTRASDTTCITFNVVFEYDDTILAPFCGGYDETMGFMPANNTVFCLCLYRILDYNMPIITQTHINRYEFEVDIDNDTKAFFDIDFTGEDFFFNTEILFDPSFTHCKVKSCVYSQTQRFDIDISQNEIDTLLTFVNHLRIFNDVSPITECVVDI